MTITKLAQHQLQCVSGGNEDGTTSSQSWILMQEAQTMAITGFFPFNDTPYMDAITASLPAPSLTQLANTACTGAFGAASGATLGGLGGVIAGPPDAIAGAVLGSTGGAVAGAVICPQIINHAIRR